MVGHAAHDEVADEINTTDPYLIEALILIAAISLMMSRVIVDELQKLDAAEQESVVDASPTWSRLDHC